ncbi:MAG: hypothetical protein WD733_11980 [Bryobacterales bacterium]
MNPRGLGSLPWPARLAALLLSSLLLPGCPSNEPELAQAPQSEAPASAAEAPAGALLSSVHMGDPAAAAQLLEGFYGVEQGVWRWTARKFSVALQAPAGAADTQIEFKFTLPEAVVGRLKSVTLTARVNDADIGSETYQQAGDHVFTKPLPASALQGGALNVEFELDKALPPTESDQRELGVVAISVALK